MSFDTAAFLSKINAIAACMPSLGQLIQAAELVAPGAAGLTKAGLVINTAIAIEPARVGLEPVLAATVTGIVTAYRSAGTLPAPADPGATGVAGGAAASPEPAAPAAGAGK